MTIMKKIFLLAAVALFSGCATMPSPKEMQASIEGYQLPVQPQEGKAIVYMVRPSHLGGLIRFNVFIDNKEDASEVGYTRGGQYIYFNLEPGQHTIYSKAENWAEAQVDANPGDIIYLQQEPTMGLIMARNSLLEPKEYTGKYYVKTLKKGTIIKADK